jgi:alkanesulfonate monooxygenase SsuD/methylene tetrahydromethanopterin reductase-like flavin-dependent oxidoreductase (luciferase family)
MQGRDMKVAYPEFTFDGFRMSPLAPVPAIDVMAVRPKMVQMAARLGDGLSISVGASAAYIRDVVADVERELAAAGRDRVDFRITAHAIAAIGDDIDAARAPIGPMMSSFPQETAAYLARGVVDPEELLRVEDEQGPFGVMKLWTPDKIDQVAFVATPAMLADRMAEYADAGVDELALMMLNSPEEQPAIIRQLSAARGGNQQ